MTEFLAARLAYRLIGLVVASLVFIYIAVIFRRHNLEQTVRHCIILAFIWIFPTMLFGYMDWQHFYRGEANPWIFAKIILGVLLTALFGYGFYLGKRSLHDQPRFRAVAVGCFLVAVAIGFCGGELQYGG